MAASCSDGGSEQEVTAGRAPATTVTVVTTSTTGATGTEVLPAFPPDRHDLEHGGASWAVVLAAADDIGHPDLAAAMAAADAAGYRTGPTHCDEGAAAAHGLDPATGVYTVSVYFDSRGLAQRAAEAFAAHGFPHGVVTEVRTYCLD